MKLFVYGSLKKGYWNHEFIERSSFLGKYHTVEKYVLVIKNELPFVATTPSVSHIYGEVYDVDESTLHAIDKMEQNGRWYTRRPVQLVDENGQQMVAELYFNDNIVGEIKQDGFF